MKRIIFIMAAALSLVACNQNTPDDTKKGGDTPTSLNQPSDPASWSPEGHIYIYETTWDDSPAADHYWAYVFNFYSEDSCVKYETPNRDLTYHEISMRTVDSSRYDMHYPTADYYSLAGGTVDIQFKDTTSFFYSGLSMTYSLIFK